MDAVKRLLAAAALLLAFPALAQVRALTPCRLDGLDCPPAISTTGPVLSDLIRLDITNHDVSLSRQAPGILGIGAGPADMNGSIAARNGTFIALTAPTVTTVLPTLSMFSTLTVVQGSDLADGDYFTLSDGTAKVFEFDTGDGVTAGRVAVTITGSETATAIRDLVVIAVNNSGMLATAVAAGADTITVTLTTPGSAGGVNSENVSNAGFLVPVWGDPTAATSYGYKAAAYLPDGTSTAASAEVTTATGHATLSAANHNAVSWNASTGAALYKLWRTTGGAAPPKLIYTGTALAFDDVGTAGTANTPPAADTTGVATAAHFWLSALNTAPANASDTGTLGEIRITATAIFVCTATDTWVKTALATW